MGFERECDVTRGRVPADTERGHRAMLVAGDGVRIEAAYAPYAGPAADSPLPVIVVAHGFTGALDRPALRRAADTFARYAAVVTFSFRGHGRSGGRSTVGDREVLDLAAAVRWARSLGHGRVATVGFSMGGSVTVRHAALHRPYGAREYGEARNGPHGGEPAGGPFRAPGGGDGDGGAGNHADAVVAVSAPARWYYRGTAPMRRLHWVVQHPAGRMVSRWGLRTRVHPQDWDPVPLSPIAAAPLIAPTPLLIVHGDRDPYFPLDHPLALATAAGPDRTELWIEPGFGHAENSAGPRLLHRIARWAVHAVAPAAVPDEAAGANGLGAGGPDR